MPNDLDYTGLAVALGRVEEKLNGMTANREADISFQQSTRDAFAELGKETSDKIGQLSQVQARQDVRISKVEAGISFIKWLLPILVTVGIFGATWISNIIIK